MTWVATSRHQGDSSTGKVALPAVTRVGKYRVLSELGRGGMANVYLAVTQGPSAVSKLVVLKALLPELATEPHALTAFLDEARLAAQLNHANVVQTYEVGTDGDRHVIVMEYLEGQSLGSVVRRSATSSSPLSLAFQLRIIISVLEGLRYAHELSAYDGLPLMLVHRDISPQNVFVTYDGQVKVLDFGIAKAASSTIHTAAGVIKGKLAYMSPEQMVGEAVDCRADVYSVGCMLWAAVAGKKLWKDTPDVQIMRAVMNGEIPSPQSVNPEGDPELCQITMKALAFDCSERFPSALDFQQELERYCELHSIPNRPRELGQFVSTLFADTRAALRARVETQLSLVDQVDTAGLSTPRPERLPSNSIDAVDRDVVPTREATALSSSPTKLFEEPRAPRSRPAKRLLLGLCLTAIVAGLFVWRLGLGTRSAVAVTLPAGGTILKGAPLSATVELRSSPANAQMYLDGEPLSGNPSALVLPKDGKIRVLRAVADGYHPATAQFTVPREEGVVLHLQKLEPEPKAARPPSAGTQTVTRSTPKPPPPSRNCAQPFFVDKDGIRKIIPACL